VFSLAELVESKAAELFGYDSIYRMQDLSRLSAETSRIHEYSKKQPF
jgi:hypothetical protein